MSTPVVMPQMGESLSEGTLTKWLKKVGDRVVRDEPLFEISTDKVDTEIPAPVTGVLEQILVVEGQTVLVGTVVGQIGGGETNTAPSPGATSVPADVKFVTPGGGHFASTHEPTTFKRRAPGTPALDHDDKKDYLSPAVMTAAREHDISIEELSRIEGTGLGGRVTKKDVEGYAARRQAAPPPAVSAPAAAPPATLDPPSRSLVYRRAASDKIVAMSALRKKTADAMTLSHRVVPQATSFAECDLHRIVRYREARAAEFEATEGIPLTFLPFAAEAAVKALKEIPLFNASVADDWVVLKKHVHLGIAVALSEGILTPVVRHADEMNFVGLARAIHDLTERARAERLSPSELEDATFTVTNPGLFGGLTGTFLIPPPQVAILGLGAVAKKPVVIDDGIGIRPILVLALSYDQRVIDPAAAFQFIERVRMNLEHFELP